ncbi:MAG: CapA family protein, partial [Woeseia sp.]
MSYYTSRRQFLSACASTPLFAAGMLSVARAGTKPSLHMTLTGQALMEHPLCPAAYAGFDAVVAEVRRGDVAFTDLEVAIKTAASGKPTRDNGFLHAAEPEVLGCLKDMGFDMLALSNNHAWDLSSAGVVATRDAVAAAGFAYAGTGANIAEAATPGYLGNSPKVALVAAASGKINELASATKDRSGVNELRLSPDGTVNPEDRKRILGSIEEAAINADYVIAYRHNQQWEGVLSVTRPWSRPGAGECVGAGGEVCV